MATLLEKPVTRAGGPRQRLRPRRRFGAGHVFVLLLLLSGSTAAGYAGYQRYSTPKMVAETISTVPVSRGSIAATVNLSGSLAAKSQAKLAFDSAGLLTSLAVKVGDSVKSGDVLANLDPSDLLLQVAQAEVALEQAKVKLAQIKEGAKEVEIAAAQAGYDSAVTKYEDLKAGAKPADVAAAQTAIRDAEVALANARSSLILTQKSDVVSKNVRDLEYQHNWYEAKVGDTVAKMRSGDANQEDLDKDYANLLTAKEKLDTARAQSDLALRKADTDVTKAEQNVANAKDNLQKLLAGPTADQLKTAQAAMLSAQAQLDTKKAGPSATDVTSQEVAIRLAEASLKQKQLMVNKAVLRAPFDGVVDSIAANVGEQVATSKEVLTLVNMKQFQITARVDETEVARLKVGQTAAITMDALPDQRLTATVSSIGAVAAVQQGVVTYPVVLELQATEAQVRPGMTSNVVVEVTRRDNVMLVPNRAIRTQGRNRSVSVMVNGLQQPRAVTVGMSNDQFTEVSSGLAEGDQVVIPSTTTVAPRVPQGGPAGVPGGMPGGGFAVPFGR